MDILLASGTVRFIIATGNIDCMEPPLFLTYHQVIPNVVVPPACWCRYVVIRFWSGGGGGFLGGGAWNHAGSLSMFGWAVKTLQWMIHSSKLYITLPGRPQIFARFPYWSQ